MNPKAYRLPANVFPRRYDIVLDARLGREEFFGTVGIQLDVQAPTSTIVLHARDLQVSDAYLASGDREIPGAVTLDPEREIATVDFGYEIAPGDAKLRLNFAGTLSKSREGLFESKDGPDDLLATQCEATGARAIIPCFDEPIYKAEIAWSVTTAPDAKVLTNGSLTATTPSADGTSVTWTFAPTKPISSYLLAMALGDLASSEERIVNGVPLGIWAPKGKEHLGMFALDLTTRLLPYYEEYFAAPYHFGKLDHLAVPSFFGGAMENAGLIIYDYAALLLDPQSANHQQETSAATVIAHEFAHMWFGDLVTMRWWDDLWLNEAFATWMSYHAIDALRPEYRIWDEVQGTFGFALESDGLANTHAIYNPVETPRAILENLDVITYYKGCAVLRMVHDFLGDDAFRNGLRTYMAEFAEKNATGPDLWRHLQAASDQPVVRLMETWVMQPGHPLISVGITQADGQTQLRLGQRRFFASRVAPESDQTWYVPLRIRYADDTGTHETRYLLTEREATVPLDVAGEVRWVYANAGEGGFYRQQLDDAALQRVLAHLDQLSPAEQRGLLRDTLALVTNGSQPISAYLDTIAALSGSTDHALVGQLVRDHLQRVHNMLDTAGNADASAAFRAWVDGLFQPTLASVGDAPQPDESTNTAQLRASVLRALAQFAQDVRVIDLARAQQAREEADVTSVDPTLAPVFVDTTARYGDAATYDRFLAIYEQRKAGGYTPQQTAYYATALAYFQQPELVDRTLGIVETFELPFLISGQMLAVLLMQLPSQITAWEWLKRNWSLISERAPMFIPPLIQISGTLPPRLRDDVASFWEGQLHGELPGPVARALEAMDTQADLEARTTPDLLAYFSRQAEPAATATASAPATVPSASPVDQAAAPATETAPVTEAAPATEATPEIEAPPVVEAAPEIEASPQIEMAPAVEVAAPTAPTPPAVEDNGAAQPASVASQTPTAAPAPAANGATAPGEQAGEQAKARGGWLRRLFGGR